MHAPIHVCAPVPASALMEYPAPHALQSSMPAVSHSTVRSSPPLATVCVPPVHVHTLAAMGGPSSRQGYRAKTMGQSVLVRIAGFVS